MTKSYLDKITGNTLTANDPLVISQFDKKPDRYAPANTSKKTAAKAPSPSEPPPSTPALGDDGGDAPRLEGKPGAVELNGKAKKGE
jgi:hypothetical protein